MIGDGWDEHSVLRPSAPEPYPGRRRVAVVTGSRAEFGLLAPVMSAVMAQPTLELACIAAGSHLVAPAETYRDVKAMFPVADAVPMQIAGRTGRYEDAESVARGVARFARSFLRLRPDWVVVLGDRIEAFAAAIAANVGGWTLAHVHGGDRAEGIADEAMRHAITKLAHVHFPATAQSAQRIISMGERRESTFVCGSPAVDGLAAIAPLADGPFEELGRPDTLFLMHPVGRPAEHEEADARAVLDALSPRRVLCLHPNLDAGRDGVLRAVISSAHPARSHLPREQFVGLLKRLSATGGILIGNSSSALIEAAALRLPAIDVGTRQSGRERPSNVVHIAHPASDDLAAAVARALAIDRAAITHPYGDGHAGRRIAQTLASLDPADPTLRRKLCAY